MIPDSEKVVSDYLRDHAGVAALVGRRVVGKNPTTRATPWIRITELDAPSPPGSRTDHLIGYLMQADCYAGADGGQPEARLLARTARAALHEMPDETLDGAVVTSVRFAGMLRLPDQDFEPARERVILTAIVYMHNAA